jgi:hypothetical protein
MSKNQIQLLKEPLVKKSESLLSLASPRTSDLDFPASHSRRIQHRRPQRGRHGDSRIRSRRVQEGDGGGVGASHQ